MLLRLALAEIGPDARRLVVRFRAVAVMPAGSIEIVYAPAGRITVVPVEAEEVTEPEIVMASFTPAAIDPHPLTTRQNGTVVLLDVPRFKRVGGTGGTAIASPGLPDSVPVKGLAVENVYVSALAD